MHCAVVGDPIAHSLSPVLHRAAYAATGLDWEYDAHRVESGGLAAFLGGLGEGWRGLSVTAPLKREAVSVGGEVSYWAQLAGAANTVLLDRGRCSVTNTDVPGAVAALQERLAATPVVATVLGGGATATSTALALCELGAGSLTLLVRSPARAVETLAAIDAHPARPAVRVGALGTDPIDGDLVVSTVPVGAQSPDLLLRCASVPVVFDVVYDPWPTPLAASAADRVLISGLDLLVHQAALQFELFTGQPASLEAMRAAGEAALAARVGEHG